VVTSSFVFVATNNSSPSLRIFSAPARGRAIARQRSASHQSKKSAAGQISCLWCAQ